MPKRTDIKKILIIGSGPTVIGQTGEFDYSIVQACKALREEGYEVVVVDSNPTTVSTSPGIADKAYIEPLTLDSLSKLIEKERPDALLSTFGGQTALNLAAFLEKSGVLEKFNVKIIGADARAIANAENRQHFKEAMRSLDVITPKSGVATSIEEGMRVIKDVKFPTILKPAYNLGGAGSAIVYNVEEFVLMLKFALDASPIHQTLIEESVLGWKQIEYEMLCDSKGNGLAITTLESIDPVGVHMGDSAVIIPSQTFALPRIDNMAELSKKITNEVGICGCASVRYAVNPYNGDTVVLGINPSVNRNSALASKATGFPIAYAAAKLAVGITLDETNVKEELQKCDHCVVKLPRFDFEKFPQADNMLDTSMKSVGEAMATGRNFKEALQKCIRSLEIGRYGLGSDGRDASEKDRKDMDTIRMKLVKPNPDRLFYIRYAIEAGMSTDEIHDITKIDPYFIENIRDLVNFEKNLENKSLVGVHSDILREAKQLGYSDIQLAKLLETDEEQVRLRRNVLGITNCFCPVDTVKPDSKKPAYVYSTYDATCELPASENKKKIVVFGPGPNRIGQGQELDYCCTKASYTIIEEGYESIIINCNPQAVSTDYEASDRLYFEPLTREDVLSIIESEKPDGVIVQFGGWAALNLANDLTSIGIKVLGTSSESMEQARNGKLSKELANKLNLLQTEKETASSLDDAKRKVAKIGYPVMVKPPHITTYQSTEIIYDENELVSFIERIPEISAEYPVYIDKFLENAVEVDVDVISDGETTLICGVMEHIEQAGVHSGDSAYSLPPYSLPKEILDEIKRQSRLLAEGLSIRGLMSVQFAIKDSRVYLLEVKPRASRMIPFVSKATGVAWTKAATKVMLGKTLKEQGLTQEVKPRFVAVKEAAFPFVRFPGVDVVLGPEMKSTGEVMGIDTNFGNAYIKAEIAAGQDLPHNGTAFVSVASIDKSEIAEIGKQLVALGFEIVATRGTAKALKDAGVRAKVISKIGEGRPDATDLIKNQEIDLIINTPSGKKPRLHEISIRSAMVARGIPIITTIAGAKATLLGMQAIMKHGATLQSLQEYSENKS